MQFGLKLTSISFTFTARLPSKQRIISYMKLNTQSAYTVSLLIIGLGLAVNGHSQSFLTNGLVAYYPFNGNAGDASGNGNNGVVHGAQLENRFGDRFGNTNATYYFNETDSYISIPDSPSLNPPTAISVSAWIKMDSNYVPAKANAGIVTKWGADSSMTGQWELGETLSGTPLQPGFSALVMFGASAPQTGLRTDYVTPWSGGEWHNLLMTYDGTTLILFQDGKVVSIQVGGGGSLAVYAQAVEIGRTVHGANGSDSYFSGYIDDVRIYSRALSTNEVQQLYLYESQTHYDGPFQIVAGSFTWSEAESDAVSRGGHLATFGTQAKWNTLVNECGSRIVVDAWIGGYQPPGSPEPAGNWTWITGEPWIFSTWWPGEPNNQGGIENSLVVCFAGVVAGVMRGGTTPPVRAGFGCSTSTTGGFD